MDHSQGILLIDGTSYADNKDFSFYVDGSTVHELHGWGRRGLSTPEVFPNPPPSPNYHTVYLPSFDEASRTAVLQLVEEHRDRYKECLVWAWPPASPLAAWVAAGMPSDGDSPRPTDVEGPFAEGPDQPDDTEANIAPPGADVPVHDPDGNPDVDFAASGGVQPPDLDAGQQMARGGAGLPADVGAEDIDEEPAAPLPPDKSTPKGSGFASGETHQRLAAFEERVDEEDRAEPNPDAVDAETVQAEGDDVEVALQAAGYNDPHGEDEDVVKAREENLAWATDDASSDAATQEETGDPDLPHEGQEQPTADDPAPKAKKAGGSKK